MKIAIELFLEHPVMFISDPHIDSVAPTDIGENHASATDTCIAFMVLSHVAGSANVTISSDKFSGYPSECFEYCLTSNSGILSLSDSYHFNYCSVPVDNGNVNVTVSIYDDFKIWIELSNVIEY